MNVVRSTFTGHPTTKATIRVFIYHHPEAKRNCYSVGSRWESFRTFQSIQKAEAFFEDFVTQNA